MENSRQFAAQSARPVAHFALCGGMGSAPRCAPCLDNFGVIHGRHPPLHHPHQHPAPRPAWRHMGRVGAPRARCRPARISLPRLFALRKCPDPRRHCHHLMALAHLAPQFAPMGHGRLPRSEARRHHHLPRLPTPLRQLIWGGRGSVSLLAQSGRLARRLAPALSVGHWPLHRLPHQPISPCPSHPPPARPTAKAPHPCPPHMALLRGVCRPRGQLVAARPFPRIAPWRNRPPHLPHQHWPLPAGRPRCL